MVIDAYHRMTDPVAVRQDRNALTSTFSHLEKLSTRVRDVLLAPLTGRHYGRRRTPVCGIDLGWETMTLVRDELEGFAEFIRERRKFLGLTQTELARRLGISPSMVTRLESGEREPSARLLLRLLEALRADLRDIKR